MQKFEYTQPELEVTKKEIQLVRLAGLCHDLGHGPFSHAFESWIHRVRYASLKFVSSGLFKYFSRADGSWKHEDMSEKMLDYLIDENGLSQYPCYSTAKE